MEREDRKRTVHQEWEANYNARGSATVDESTTTLAGNRREANLIVRGLQALHGQVIIREAAGIEHKHDNSWGDTDLGMAPQIAEIETLLGEIALPNYVAEPEVTRKWLG